MIRFQEKQYGIGVDTARGAGIGAALAVGANKIMNTAIKPDWVTRKVIKVTRNGHLKGRKSIPPMEVIAEGLKEKSATFLSKFGKVGEWLKGGNKSFWDNLGKLGAWIMSNPGKAAIAGAAIGASIAAGYYLIKAAYNKVDQKLTGFRGKMIDRVVDYLITMGYKRDTDFTTNPAQADYLKTKVCIVVSSTKDVVNITVNSINDPKLEPVARQIIKNLPSGSQFYQRESDKSNELTLAVTHSNNGDHVYIASIVERFIKKKYPVFIIEIN